ncbi:hypothetical protein VIBHAR_06537 [Vibrio campbellii ATCC BAA-1116]|uniref:Uncharacterized protein n=1 Tax=Vibrio campbellii (strain ATCC BAA-1116) TaxID=2902295 RepID=A7N8E4_VIBC1|nr:hypothetical protein VIBHAR_06537 [Vibrio campbellii ATCC BAA-1116]
MFLSDNSATRVQRTLRKIQKESPSVKWIRKLFESNP